MSSLSDRALATVDALAWVLIYAGLIMVVLGIATGEVSVWAGWSFGVLGTVAAIAGVVLIAIRPRLGKGGGAQSSAPSDRGTP